MACKFRKPIANHSVQPKVAFSFWKNGRTSECIQGQGMTYFRIGRIAGNLGRRIDPEIPRSVSLDKATEHVGKPKAESRIWSTHMCEALLLLTLYPASNPVQDSYKAQRKHSERAITSRTQPRIIQPWDGWTSRSKSGLPEVVSAMSAVKPPPEIIAVHSHMLRGNFERKVEFILPI
jgi:hypothetical protein